MTDAPAPKRSIRRRKPFTAIRKGLTEHVLSGRLKGTAFATYVWLHMLADYRTGTVWTNAGRLASELGLHPVTIRRDLAVLRERGYIRYDSAPGSRELYAVIIEKYDCHFERNDASGEQVPLHAPLQAPLQAPLHERRASARGARQNRAPKNIEVRSKKKPSTTATLRVRCADAQCATLAVGQDVETASTAALSRADALAAVPAILRETLELFFLKTGRAELHAAEFAALGHLEQAHTPAVIQRAMSAAVARFTRRGQSPSDLTLTYVRDSLKHFTTRRTRAGPLGTSAARTYPDGLTRLYLPEDVDGRDSIPQGPQDSCAGGARREAGRTP